MKITPEPTPRKVLYPIIVAAAALTSCQQEQALSGAPMPPPSVQPGKNAEKTPVKTKTGTPRKPQWTVGKWIDDEP